MAAKFDGSLDLILPPWHEGQKNVYAARRKTNIICAHRGWFKSSMGVSLAVRHLLSGQNMGWYAGTSAHIRDAMEQFRTVVRNNEGTDDWFNKSEHTFQIPGKGKCFFYSLEVPDNARGPSYPLVIGDEAGTWEEGVFSSIVKPIAQKVDGTIYLFGTPNTRNPNNWFYNMLHTAKKYPEDMASWIIPARGAIFRDEKLVFGESPMVRYANPKYPFKSDEVMQRDYDMELRKRKWLVEYLCAFVSDEGGQFENIEAVCKIPAREVETGKWFAHGYESAAKRHNGWFQIGIDVAMVNDFTVISVLDRMTNEQVYMHRFCPGSMEHWDRVYQAIVDVMGLFPGVCNVDCSGQGASLITEMPRRNCAITPFIFNSKNKPPLLDHLSMLIATNKVKLFDLDVIKFELGAMERKQMANTVKIAAAGDQHDDVPISLALMCKDVRPLGQVASLGSSIDHLLVQNGPINPWHEEW